MRRTFTVMLFTAAWVFAHSDVRGQTNEGPSSASNVRYPTMLDMTFPEFEAATKKTNIVLVPIGAIEEHNAHLPLGTDAMNATAQVFHIQQYLRTAGVDTIVGPPLNIGITNEAGDWVRDGTYAYPGSLTIARARSSLCTSTCCGRCTTTACVARSCI